MILCILAAAMENMWLDELNDVLEYPIALAKAAIANGHIQFLNYIITLKSTKLIRLKNIDLGRRSPFDLAAENGYLEMIKYLHTAGYKECSNAAMDGAAGNGHLHIVKWLH
ncbi:hypothetical protein THRCLA_21265 [Thraustotheca clavata]|uniref:Uncharacterized protein n=1 Tax=Thraustotheca clavata TaxID=74557 RepID=A0A1V9ZYE0_9STRA|nr:hypothetical protein THRCLA_21265 [Thraustotheca clavata]